MGSLSVEEPSLKNNLKASAKARLGDLVQLEDMRQRQYCSEPVNTPRT